MSIEAKKGSSTNTPIFPQKPEGGFLNSLKRLLGISSEQPVPGIIQSPPALGGLAGIVNPEQNAGVSSVVQPTQQPIAPDLGKPLDVALEVGAIVDKLILTEQETRRKQEEEKARQEKESRLKEEEDVRRKAEERVQILALNERAREIAEISGVRGFFSQAQLSLVRLYPNAAIVEGWGNHKTRELIPSTGIYDAVYTNDPEFLKSLPDDRYLNYHIRLTWKTPTKYMMDIYGDGYDHNYIEADCGRDRSWNYYYPGGMGERVIIHMSAAHTTLPGKTLKDGQWQDDNIHILGRVFKEGEWQNPEEIKRAVIEGIKSPLRHSTPRQRPRSTPIREPFGTAHG